MAQDSDQKSRNCLFVIFTDMTISQIEAENTQMTNDLYRLLKKYSGLRNLIRELKVMLFRIITMHETAVNHFLYKFNDVISRAERVLINI